MPESRGRRSGAVQDWDIIVRNNNISGRERNLAACITQLADRDKRLRSQGRHDVALASSQREERKIKLSIMGGIHDAAVGIANSDGDSGRTFVEHWRVDSEEIASAASVGDAGVGRISGGRTSGS